VLVLVPVVKIVLVLLIVSLVVVGVVVLVLVVKVQLVLVLVLMVLVVLVLVIVRDERTHMRRLDALERCCIHFLMATAAVLSVVSRHHLTIPPTRPEHFGSA
jgi:hypothetical protein